MAATIKISEWKIPVWGIDCYYGPFWCWQKYSFEHSGRICVSLNFLCWCFWLGSWCKQLKTPSSPSWILKVMLMSNITKLIETFIVSYLQKVIYENQFTKHCGKSNWCWFINLGDLQVLRRFDAFQFFLILSTFDLILYRQNDEIANFVFFPYTITLQGNCFVNRYNFYNLS